MTLLCRALNSSWRATGIGCWPSAMTALRFFAPMTAPTPPRPATRCWLTMAAKRTRFSPAGPMTALPKLAGSASCVAMVPLPHRREASLSVTARR